MKDIFGNELTLEQARKLAHKAPAHMKKQGHAAPPGSGPAGHSCGDCKHLARRSFSKVYLKCGLMQASWTGGAGTDVRAHDPACRRWESNAKESK